VAEYIQRFKEVKNRCYSIRILEKEAVELAILGLVKRVKDLVFQLEFNSGTSGIKDDNIRATTSRVVPRQVQASGGNG
jgi:hypothetical protein